MSIVNEILKLVYPESLPFKTFIKLSFELSISLWHFEMGIFNTLRTAVETKERRKKR